MKERPRRYGLLLPHFGTHASTSLVVEGARLAERLGFDSVWVRDHLVFRPHHLEDQSRTHLEPLTMLAAVGATTERLILGTGSLTPHRHPIYLAGALATLSHLIGDRLILGFGFGTFEHEFAAIGLGGVDRFALLTEQLGVLRRLWTGESVTHEGAVYRFENVRLEPTPVATPPIWYCGNAAAAVRRTSALDAQGWMPGRITFPTFAKRVKLLRRLAEESGKPVPEIAAIPITSPARTREEALAKVNVAGLIEDANTRGRWVLPASGRFEKAEDLAGALIAGTPEQVAEDVERYHAMGLSHLVFDLRFRFDEFLDCVHIIGEEVLPLLRRGRVPA